MDRDIPEIRNVLQRFNSDVISASFETHGSDTLVLIGDREAFQIVLHEGAFDHRGLGRAVALGNRQMDRDGDPGPSDARPDQIRPPLSRQTFSHAKVRHRHRA